MACIRKRRDRWVIDFYDQHGKRRWETMPEGSTKKATRDRLREIEEKVIRLHDIVFGLIGVIDNKINNYG